MDFSQMQTPPPTRDATSRRSMQQSGGNGFGTPATVIQRTPTQVPTTDALFNQTPFGFSNIPFSPGMMPFANAGPMSAPPMPHSRLFWDQPNDNTQMDVDIPLASDPFGPTPHRIDQSISWQTFQSPVANQMNPQASYQALHGMSSPGPVASYGTSHLGGGQNSRPNSFVSTSAGVDPSMLFSFSNPGLTTSFGSIPQQANKQVGSRQPYETQTRDSLREKEMAKKAKSQHSRTNTNSSSGSVEDIKPSLQRSNTDSGFRRHRPSSMESRNSGQAAASTIPRRSSPLKRQSGVALTAIPEIRRPRTRLIIDETGRARTETVPVGDEEDTPRDMRMGSQKDMRRQYPGLWEEDDTESDDDEPAPAVGRNTSFSVPQPQRRSMKHARAESGGLERSNSFKIPRLASRPASSAFDKASFETVRPVRKLADNPSRRFSMMDFPTSFESVKQSEDQHMPDSPGDALGALKKVVAGRQQRIERASHNTLKAHNQRWAQASADLTNTTTPHGYGHYDPFTNSFNASPNTDGLTTPSTDRSSRSSESTRCVCNGVDDGQPMVQCESCNKWLHMDCVGLNANNLPPVFVCIFCTGQTPIARGGRVRGPVPFDSPLTHKSMFRR
ncbi:uncharacterized protein K460DRAFT_289323 [Cucurbitaria berberidis CBS 394.84]|uniref:PHD-type domain-containing protein n=1 Tax=Cucurbitaria berberidis CBS 394.84 TaxID=1168544 RepID=A0A9P4GFB6_9PLEO|nr:uncharacterized protein K460DRAFT_289323 [Cucurbitaria berberidis CBS 394.84]KAF1844226.1 hypothetical protein K460DRAFT_289323 [Cucurbitaria berberidis CBS 394.84]